jgi:hypothetical protein
MFEYKKPRPSDPPHVFDTIEKSGLVHFLKILGNLAAYLHVKVKLKLGKGNSVKPIHLCVGEALMELIIATQNFKTKESDCCGSLDHIAGALQRETWKTTSCK